MVVTPDEKIEAAVRAERVDWTKPHRAKKCALVCTALKFEHCICGLPMDAPKHVETTGTEGSEEVR